MVELVVYMTLRRMQRCRCRLNSTRCLATRAGHWAILLRWTFERVVLHAAIAARKSWMEASGGPDAGCILDALVFAFAFAVEVVYVH